MKTETRKTFEIVLTLNEKEAKYLKSLTQNYPGDIEYDTYESQDEKELRKLIFQELDKALSK